MSSLQAAPLPSSEVAGWAGRQAAGVYAAWRLVVVLVGVCEKWGEI